MRWVLTWKRADGGTKAKARLVILGFQHPDLTSLDTAAPTLTRAGRHFVLSAIALQGLTMENSDATSAFIQADGSEEERDLLVISTRELAWA